MATGEATATIWDEGALGWDEFWADIPAEYRDPIPRFLLNGFPKSGLHLLSGMLRAVAAPLPAGQFHGSNWVGTFHGNSWTRSVSGVELMGWRIARLQPGYFLKGHIGYSAELERFMWYCGLSHIFIYRDPRDVAVSQAHHILSESESFVHPDKPRYQRLYEAEGFGAVLAKVIVGWDQYAGVMARWPLYAGWLSVPWVCSVRFEDVVGDREHWAGHILRYAVDRTARIVGGEGVAEEGPALADMAHKMAEASRDTSGSPTFREGKTGGWRTVFTDEHKQQFKESDTSDWLIRLGYETSRDW